LDVPFANDPFVILPIFIFDKKINTDSLTYQELIASNPDLWNLPYVKH